MLRKLTRPEAPCRTRPSYGTRGLGEERVCSWPGTTLPELSSGELRLQDTDKVSGLIE